MKMSSSHTKLQFDLVDESEGIWDGRVGAHAGFLWNEGGEVLSMVEFSPASQASLSADSAALTKSSM